MKARLLLVLAVWGVSAGVSSELLGCGNKFLVASRGTRFGKAPIARAEASILVYADPTSQMADATGNVPVEQILAEAGYQPVTVTDPGQLDEALQQGNWDLVLADLSASADLRTRLGGIDAPMVVPVLFQPTRAVMAQAKKEYDRVVRAPVKSHRFVQTIDDAVALRSR
jgi:CheY-like chemotaxis protein